MNEFWLNQFKDKKIAIWGFGKEGFSSYRFLKKLLPNQVVTILDVPSSSVFQNSPEGSLVKTIDEVSLEEFDCILKSPGIVVEPDQVLSTMTSQSELFIQAYRTQVIGITGTKGKSTTSSLTYALIQKEKPVVLVGNIGNPCFDEIEAMEQGSFAVFELSCHQLEFSRVSPHIAVFLNLFQEHLDHYGSYESYGLAKSHIYQFQQEGDVCILAKEFPEFIPTCERAKRIGVDIYARDGFFYSPLGSMAIPHTKLIGHHNEQNMAVAVYIAQYLNISEASIQKGLEEFEPLEHRLEYVGEYQGIHYVNDSISTIGQSCIQAIESLPKVQTILIGGMDRGIEYQELEDYIQNHPSYNYVFMYGTGKRILKELGQLEKNYYSVNSLQEAVSLAKKITDPGRMVLLSPAASSYDAFKNFEDRGRQFKEMVAYVVE